MKQFKQLQAVWSPPLEGEAPKSLVVILHGLGGHGSNSISLSEPLAESLPNTAFIAPDGPEECDMMYWDEKNTCYVAQGGRQWTSLQDKAPTPVWEGLERNYPHLDNFLNLILKNFNLPNSRLAIIGFSQGGMMAMHTGLRRKQEVAAVVSFSGRLLPGPGKDPNTLKMVKPNSLPPMLLIHGDADQVVPIDQLQYSTSRLREAGVHVRNVVRPDLNHGIDENGLFWATNFLKKRLYPREISTRRDDQE